MTNRSHGKPKSKSTTGTVKAKLKVTQTGTVEVEGSLPAATLHKFGAGFEKFF